MERALIEAAAVARSPSHAQARTVCDVFQETVSERADQVALRTLKDGVSMTFGEYAQTVERVAGALHALGVRSGDTVAMMLTNRPEFHPIDAGAMHLGAVAFSIYNSCAPEQIAHLLSDAGARVFVFEEAFAQRARAGAERYGAVEHAIVLDGAGSGECSYEQLLAIPAEPGFDFEASWRAVEPSQLLTLIYTSGTTGPPKGVQITHANAMAELRAIDLASSDRWPGGHVVSYLPLAHVADRMLCHYGQMWYADTITTCPDVRQVFAHVMDARPTMFGAVPRVVEKLQAALEAGFAAEPDEARRAALSAAMELSLRRARLLAGGAQVPAELEAAWQAADAQVFAPLRAQLGLDRCTSFVVGAAPVTQALVEFFAALGMWIREVWGMSELSCVATAVPPGSHRIGTVGKALPGVELKLADDGEVLVRGGIVMAGYRNAPEKTAEAIDSEGWLHTGDVGELDDEGWLRIVDRKKELIISSGGKNMSPANIEAQLKSASPLIGQAVAIGDGRPFNVALVVLDPDALAQFAATRGLHGSGPAELAACPEVQEAVAAAVQRANEHLSRVEQIKRFTVLPDEWQPAGDELTPTMKLRRRPIAEKYAAQITALYG